MDTEFLSQLFTSMDTKDSLTVLAFLLLSFLIGWLFCLWAKAGRIRKLKKALKDKDDELVTLRAKYNTLVEDYELKDADLKKAYLAQEEYQTNIHRLEQGRNQAAEELQLLKNQNAQYHSQQQEYETQIENLNTQIIGLKAQNSQLSASLQSNPSTYNSGVTNSTDISALENSAKHNSTRLELLEAKLNRLSNENEALKQTVNQIKTNPTSTTTVVSTVNEADVNITERAMLAKSNIKNMLGNRIVKASVADKDDLKLINGIGPFIEDKLNQIGIYTFEQIEQFDEEIIEQITDAIQFFPGRIKRDDWVGQASELFND